MNASESVLKTEMTKTVQMDVFTEVVHEIENISEEQAIKEIGSLLSDVDYNYFKLGGLLSVVRSNDKWFQSLGYENFKTFVKDMYGLEYRKAMYLISIYEALSETKIPYAKVADLGWTKLKELASILTMENVDYWVERAVPMTVLQLQEAIKAAKAGRRVTRQERNSKKSQMQLWSKEAWAILVWVEKRQMRFGGMSNV